MTKPLTQKQENFCQSYVVCGNATQAYKEAYSARKMKDETIRVKAFELMQNGNISERIASLSQKSAQLAVMTKADVLRETMRLARFDIRKLYDPETGAPIPIHKLDDETAAAVQAVDVHEEYIGNGEDRTFVGYTKKYKVADKNSALDKLFKHFGLFEEDNKQKHSDLTDEELDRRIAEKQALKK